MTVTTDAVALNNWLPCAYPGQVAAGESHDTMLLGQHICITADSDGVLSCHALGDDGSPGARTPPWSRSLPSSSRRLAMTPGLCQGIPEFDEPDRRIVNCGSVGVNTRPYRIVENFLDMAHFCFVHTNILGAVDQTGSPDLQDRASG